jgi:hypothetical protein
MKHSPVSRSFGERLAWAIVDGHDHPGTVGELAAAMGLPVRTLQRHSHAAGITAKAAVDFVRCLHLVLDTSVPWDPAAQLSCRSSDPRTIRRILSYGALTTTSRPALECFLASQRLIPCGRVLNDVRGALRAGDYAEGSLADDADDADTFFSKNIEKDNPRNSRHPLMTPL